MGGENSGGSLSSVERLTFSTEAISLAGYISLARDPGASFESHSYGYFVGGGNPMSSVIDRIAFVGEIFSLSSATLSAGRTDGCGLQSPLAGYAAGGAADNGLSILYSTLEKLVFSTETRTMVTSSMSSARNAVCGFSSLINGYMAGGDPVTSAVDRIAFSSEVTNTMASMVVPRHRGAGVENN
jgi:hypothetical protein